MAKKPNPKVITKKHLARLERERIQNRNIIVVAIVVIVLVLGLIGYGILDKNVLQGNRAVAQVGSDSISLREFQTEVRFNRWTLINQYNQTLQMMQLFGSDPNNPYAQQFQSSLQQITTQLNDPNTMASTVVDQLIADRVIRQEAKRRGITVTQAEVDKAMEEQFGYTPNGTSTPTMTSTPWPTSTLSAAQTALFPPTSTPTITSTPTTAPSVTPGGPTVTPEPSSTPTEPAATATGTGPTATSGPTDTPEPSATPLNAEGYRQRVNDLVTQLKPLNISESDLRRIVESQVYYRKVFEAITQDVEASQDQIWARHILVADEATATKVEDELKAGAKFADEAAKYSSDSSNTNGGDLGWFAKGKMVKEFEDSAFSLKIGEVSKPVKSQFGYHIIQVLGHEVRPLSETDLQTAKQTKFQSWMDEQQKKPEVKKYDTVWQGNVPTEPTSPATTG